MKAMLAMAAALSGCCYKNWTDRDVLLQGTIIGLQAVDWGQTQGITADGRELNPIVGAHGERVPLNLYAPAIMVCNVLVSAVLPHGWMRTSWQVGTVGVQTWSVVHNHNAGY